MTYFEYLEPEGVGGGAEIKGRDDRSKSKYPVDFLNALREDPSLASLEKLAVRSNQVINSSLLLHTEPDEPFENDQIQLESAQIKTDSRNEEEEKDWVEENLTEEAVANIQELTQVEADQEDLPTGEQEETISSLSGSDDFITLSSRQELSEKAEVKKLKKKLKKSGLKHVVDVHEEASTDFSNWLVALKPMKGSHIRQMDKIKSRHSKKSKVEASAEKSIKKNTQMVSEPLAQLLAAQGHNLEAIEMYKRLILNIPEKSAYFAARIEELKNKA
ncbi:MAG: hypothetical protein KDC49_11010 [Saprospiraceae bacterium]|nr:hypothetical protein [Saprospiraceae bacterium]